MPTRCSSSYTGMGGLDDNVPDVPVVVDHVRVPTPLLHGTLFCWFFGVTKEYYLFRVRDRIHVKSQTYRFSTSKKV